MNKSNQNFSPAPYHSSNDSNILFKINTSLGSYDIMTFDNNSFIDEKDNTISNFPIYEQEKIKADDNDFIQKKKTKILYKFRDDHLKRKCKHLVIESAIEFINKKISEVYGGDIGEGLLKKKLLKLNQDQKKDSHADFNKQFLYVSLRDILSHNITKKIKYNSEDHNKNLINELIDEKGDIFEKIFNITFIECLEHFAGVNTKEELKGLKLFSELKEQIIQKDGISYYNNLEIFLKEYKKRINNANPRKKKKKLVEDDS